MAKTSVLLTSFSAASAAISCIRIATCDVPSASKVPNVEVTEKTWKKPGVATASATVWFGPLSCAGVRIADAFSVGSGSSAP